MKVGDIVRVTTRAYTLERLTYVCKSVPPHFVEPGTMGTLAAKDNQMYHVWLVRMFNGSTNGSPEEGWWLGDEEFELVAQGGDDEDR